MKKLISLIITVVASTSFALSPCCKKKPATNCDATHCETIPNPCCTPTPANYCDTIPNPCCDFLAPSISCRTQCNNPRRGVNFQLIFSQPRQDGLDYVINNSALFGSKALISQPDFDWFVGARGEIEYTLYYDQWNLNVNGMVINASAKDRQRQDIVDQTQPDQIFNGMGLIPIWTHPASYGGNLRFIRYSYSDAKWKQQFYSVNLMLGKKFCISKQITFLPSFGLGNITVFDNYKVCCKEGKTFPISQTATLHPISSYSKNEQDTFGVGPKVGVDTRWYFFPNANFFAGAYGSLLYTYFYSERHDINNFQIQGEAPSRDEIKMKHNFSSIKPAVELMLGISLEHCIMNKHNAPQFYRFSFGYGINYIWKLNQFIQFDDDVNDGNFFTIQGDLHMQEVNVGLTYIF